MTRSSKLVVALMATLGVVGVAQAHVTIWPREVPAQSFQAFTVRVPTEKDVPTISVRVTFPPGVEILRFRPREGWRYELERDATGRIVGVTWSGGKIGREEYEEFGFVGRVGEQSGPLMFKAYQTYQGGEVVEWVNAAEPHPAPQVAVTPAVSQDGPPPADPFAASGAAGTPRDTRPATPATSTSLSTGVSLLALVVAVAALARSRKRA